MSDEDDDIDVVVATVNVDNESNIGKIFLKMTADHDVAMAQNIDALVKFIEDEMGDAPDHDKAGFVHAFVAQSGIRSICRYLEVAAPLYNIPAPVFIRTLLNQAVTAEVRQFEKREADVSCETQASGGSTTH